MLPDRRLFKSPFIDFSLWVIMSIRLALWLEFESLDSEIYELRTSLLVESTKDGAVRAALLRFILMVDTAENFSTGSWRYEVVLFKKVNLATFIGEVRHLQDISLIRSQAVIAI